MATEKDFSWVALSDSAFLANLSQNSASLTSGYRQSSKNVTYSFYTETVTPPSSDFKYVPSGESADFKPFTQAQINTFQGITSFLSNIVDLTFTQVTAGTGLIHIGNHNMTYGGYASYPWSYQTLFIDNTGITSTSGFYTAAIWHEMGHALGLKHPQDSPNILNEALDTTLYSTMSYTGIYTGASGPLDYAPLDIFELLKLYGPAKQSNGINYKFNKTTSGFNQTFVDNNYTIDLPFGNIFWVYGTRGNDSIDVSNAYYFADSSIGVSANASSGYIEWDYSTRGINSGGIWSYTTLPIHANLYFYPADNINSFPVEKLILTDKKDTIVNGVEFKEINSMGGDDEFSGFADGVTLDGGLGSDKLTLTSAQASYLIKKIDSSTITISDLGNTQHLTLSNFETINFSGSSVILANQTLSGTAKNDYIKGGLGNDLIFTGNKDDTINGDAGDDDLFGELGNDTLTGGEGSDFFYFDTKLNGKTNVDTITDFEPGFDVLALDALIFKKLGNSVETNELWLKSSGNPQPSTGFLIYESNTGTLSYDTDGRGKGKPIMIGLIGTDLDLQASDLISYSI